MGTHYEFSQLAKFPTTFWTDGNAMAQHYAVAWFDRWLKAPGEPGFDDADARLLDDVSWRDAMSFYYRSARAYSSRDGVQQSCEDLRAGCADVDPSVERVAGADRFETAGMVADEVAGSGPVLLAEGIDADPARGWPDALSAAGLGSALRAPVPLTATDALPTATADRLEGAEVLLVGGTAAVSAEVEDQVAGVAASVERLAGADRYATARVVADQARERGEGEGVLHVATGGNWPDALVAGAAVGRTGGLLIMADPSGRQDVAGPLLRDLGAGVESVRVVGGPAVLGDAVLSVLRGALSG